MGFLAGRFHSRVNHAPHQILLIRLAVPRFA
jgi:hypothetical protein